MSVTPLFRQWNVPRQHLPITDMGAVAEIVRRVPRYEKKTLVLNKSRSNTPKAGHYYVNPQLGLYIVPGDIQILWVTYRPAVGARQKIKFEPSQPTAGGESSGADQTQKGA